MGEPKRRNAAAEKPVIPADDPIWQAALRAPIVEATPEELAAFDEGLADIRAGRIVRAEEVRAGIEERRRAEG